ncbi:MAG: MBL fold metallo-hydrolase [Fusobacteriaceae bacterium]
MKLKVKFLGTAQDAGIPQVGCRCKMCSSIKKGERERRLPVSLGVYHEETGKKYMFEATPAFTDQYERLQEFDCENERLDGIFLTHAHIGHYTGLFYLGKEALNTKKVKVYVSEKMKRFLEKNAPWDQLIKRGNIVCEVFQDRVPLEIASNFHVIPIEFPHRNEYADTFGFLIKGTKKLLFLPDLDSWKGIEDKVNGILEECEYAVIDATFYSKNEIGKERGRDYSEIPHPSIEETVKAMEEGVLERKNCRIIFSHFNHTNSVLSENKLREDLEHKNYIISQENQILEL